MLRSLKTLGVHQAKLRQNGFGRNSSGWLCFCVSKAVAWQGVFKLQVFVNYVTQFENTLPGQPERARASKAWALRLGLHLTLGSCARKALVVGAEARARCFQIAFFKIMLRNLKTPCRANRGREKRMAQRSAHVTGVVVTCGTCGA